MVAPKLWHRKCALAVTALLLVVPASAQDATEAPAGSAEPAADEAADADEAAEPDVEEPDVEEPDVEEPQVDSAIQSDILEQLTDIEEILITGEKTHTLQDAPISSTSFSAADLKALRIENIADLSDYTPNLEINTAFAASNPTIFIRGIGLKDYNANAAGAVAVYQDGVNINSPAIQLGQLFDLEGIDVLRGPQGSLNGRNATAGAIMMRSAMPTGEFEVSTSLTYGNYDDKEVEAAINIPLVEDMLSMRVSGTAQFRDGYTKNHCSGWDPTRYGFQAFTEDSIRAAYEGLDPSPGQWDSSTNQFRPVMIRNQSGSQTFNDFVYLDLAAAQALQGQANVGGVGLPASWRFLTEDLVNPDGSPQLLPNGQPALAGTRIATQANAFEFDSDLVDKVCMLVQPGKIATPEGAALPSNDWDPGQFLERNIQPSLEDFANLKPYTNNVDNWSARMILLFEPMDNMDWMLNAHGQQNRGDSLHAQMVGANALGLGGFREFLEAGLFNEQSAAAITGYRINEGFRSVPGVEPAPLSAPGEGGGNPYAGFYSSDGIELLDHWGVNGRGFWDLGVATVTLLYDYEWYDRMVEDEGDANPIILFPAIWSDSAWQTTEELRVQGEGDRYKWTTGLFFLYEELKSNNVFPNTLQYRLNQRFDQTLLSWAPYLAGELDIVEEGTVPGIYELVLNVGVRYNQEYKEFSLTSSAIGNETGLAAVQLPEQTVDDTWKEWTGDIKLSYTPFSNDYGTLLTYLSYGHGFKGGHFNASLLSKSGAFSQSIDPVDPEFIDAIELGVRSRWFDERLMLNAAVFRYWYERLQVFDLADGEGVIPAQQLLNGDAKVFGAEVDFRAQPIPGLSLNGTFGYNDGEFTDFTVFKTIRRARDPNPTPVEFDYTGNRLVASPEFNWSLVTDYEIPLFGWGFLVPQYAFNYGSKRYLDPQMLDPISQDGYWIHDAQIAYRTPDERIEVAFWVANLFDEEYKVDSFDIAREFNSIIEIWGEPRMYGVTLSLNW